MFDVKEMNIGTGTFEYKTILLLHVSIFKIFLNHIVRYTYQKT